MSWPPVDISGDGDDLESALLGLEGLVGDDGDDLLSALAGLDYDISGDDDDDVAAILGLGEGLVGRKHRRGKHRVSSALAKAHARAAVKASVKRNIITHKLAASQGMIRERTPQKNREWALGLDSGAALIPAATGATIVARPQMLFRIERLVVPSDIAGDFTIEQFTVGTVPQLAATSSLPARVFQENAVGMRFSGDTAQPGIDVTLIVTNNAGAARRFRGVIMGQAIT